MMSGSDGAAWAALIVAAFAMLIALGQVSQQYASSGQLIRLCDSVVYGGRSGLPGKGRRVWSWSQFRFRVLYEVPIFRLPRGKSDPWDVASLSSVRFTEAVDIVANEKYWTSLAAEPQVGEAAWVSFCRRIKTTCHDRVLITLKHDDADRVPPELPNIPVPISLRDVILMALTIGLDCTEACFTRRSLAMQGDSGVITSSNHPILGLVIHFAPHSQSFEHTRPKHWQHWIARALGRVPVAENVLAWHGRHGLTFYERLDSLLREVLNPSQNSQPIVLHNRPKIQTSSNHCVDASTFGCNAGVASLPSKPKDLRGDGDSGLGESIIEPAAPGEQNPQHSQISRSSTSFSYERQDSERTNFDSSLAPKKEYSQLKWYWISQMTAVEGHFASPWRDDIDVPVCVKAFSAHLRTLVFDECVGLQLVKFPGESIKAFFDGEVPQMTYPPYALSGSRAGEVGLRARRPRQRRTPPPPGWRFYPTFNADLPELAILGATYFTFDDFDRQSSYEGVAHNKISVYELMRFDQWLNRAAETEPVLNGKCNLLRNTPALVQYVIDLYYEDFQYCHMIGHSSKDYSNEIRARFVKMGLSDAEITFLTVALLRTLRYAICLGSGLNTRPALQILWHDLAAHMV